MVQNSIQALQDRMKVLEKGGIGRGRQAQATLREWASDLLVARKHCHLGLGGAAEKELGGLIVKAEAAMTFLRVYSKHAPSTSELARVHQEGLDAGLTFHVGMAREVALKRIQGMVGSGKHMEALDLVYSLTVGSVEETETVATEALNLIFKSLWLQKGDAAAVEGGPRRPPPSWTTWMARSCPCRSPRTWRASSFCGARRWTQHPGRSS